jgi:hypothetical protein
MHTKRISSLATESDCAGTGCGESWQPHRQIVGLSCGSRCNCDLIPQQLTALFDVQHDLASFEPTPAQQQLPLERDSTEHRHPTLAHCTFRIATLELPNSCTEMTAESTICFVIWCIVRSVGGFAASRSYRKFRERTQYQFSEYCAVSAKYVWTWQ